MMSTGTFTSYMLVPLVDESLRVGAVPPRPGRPRPEVHAVGPGGNSKIVGDEGSRAGPPAPIGPGQRKCTSHAWSSGPRPFPTTFEPTTKTGDDAHLRSAWRPRHPP